MTYSDTPPDDYLEEPEMARQKQVQLSKKQSSLQSTETIKKTYAF